MATYAQLQAERWWGREVITPELDWLGDELCRRTGRPRNAAGSKGDRLHLNGSHRSQEWILNSRYCTNRTYTVQSGLTAEQLTHIAGFDFTPGSDKAMIAQCKRLMAALQTGQLEEVREFYGNVDGDRWVDGWDNLRDRAATSDSTHLWHWHLSIDRRKLRDRRLMERILATALGHLPEEADMPLTDADLGKVKTLIRAELEAAKGAFAKAIWTDFKIKRVSDDVPIPAGSHLRWGPEYSRRLLDRDLDVTALAQAIADRVDNTLDVAAAAQALREVLTEGVGEPDEPNDSGS